ncbi:Fe-S oxidoreductase [Rathayibacter rathayi]|uniref:Fe-S oxidoreductase n=1 Tax=Rathayibacter rathayi TaxID=33887 RepID=A0ABD6WCB2_RATRA|nr:Fe-S oxidoreductase [Rathayibacter rathayi]AZZ48355.1 Fe-S oxidoreductase [Rathayibacter rathayi]MWV74256.1 Fe-S oxidoreductase [Rathayibacter rathayi NCPPB 2980 = VKM Ac-1601]PPF15996.1 Fe-S oxidoreductase [Rathayibacter rathayi]PPF23941.1 Fe-S oxidoreductase [Rathayibacter rathayi]PPF49334.1 Fe-S oxidoreductase [Rathayibacter rathayi]
MSALRRRVAKVALDPAITRPGYLFACAIGLAWGALWSTGPIRRSHGLVVFTGLPSWAFSRGGSCVGTSYLTRTNVSDQVLEHEAVHKEQWRLYGMWFPLVYTVAGRDPLSNRFEIEAGLEKGGYLRGH